MYLRDSRKKIQIATGKKVIFANDCEKSDFC
jgi:hypothetical protein